MRRLKYVPSREVSATEIEILEARPAPPPAPPSPVIEELRNPDSPPAIDPSEIGHYREPRPRRHRLRYRFAQLSTAGTLFLTANAVIAVGLSDEIVAKILAIVSVAVGGIAVYLALRSRMASRVLGYAIAAAALSAITAIIILTLPKDWFEERHPEHLPPTTEYRSPRPTS